MARKLNYALVDVFTTRPLEGNPLAVFTNPGALAAATMQRLAAELNLSETVFVMPPVKGGTARLRIFTPRAEIPFAVHPIVGAAYVIGRAAPIGLVRFETGVGEVPVVIDREGGFVSRCTMTQPAPRYARSDVSNEDVAKSLGARVIGDIEEGSNGPTFLLAMVDDVDALAPDMTALARLPHAVGVFERPKGATVRQRLFAPALGVRENPGTGSLAGVVGARLLRDGLVGAGALEVHQGAQLGRACVILVELAAGAPPRVGGACASVARGAFELPLHV